MILFLTIGLLVFSKTAALLGGRIQHIACGAAMLRPEDGQFMKAAFCCEVISGYGSSETASIGSCTLNHLVKYRGVGHRFSDCEMRIVSYPALGYEACPEDGSNPKGELQMRGPTVFAGYYKNPEATANSFSLSL
ncbi:hypothetical protein KIPB_013253, partial [Kipferlia bialata]|eukprot:g13253.t1